uniref:Coiled-coil domain containing 102B n=1 Tax=Sarcophilus harrisii TaxID=9305 RepID=A0A7N4NNZ3_SARHA
MNLNSIRKLIEETQIFKFHMYTNGARNFCAHSYGSNDWDICEELRIQELEEVKARAAQMEKTMRWWSDCTANWREKWSKIRIERNKAREEGRQLRIKLEMTMKELSTLKKKQSSPNEKVLLDAEVLRKEKCNHVEDSCPQEVQFSMTAKEYDPPKISLGNIQISPKEDISKKKDSTRIMDLQGPDFFRKDLHDNCMEKSVLSLDDILQPSKKELSQISTLKFHLDESQKNLWKEREMRSCLEKEVELLASALSLWKCKYEEMKASKEINLNQENEEEKVSEDRKDEANCQTRKDRLICELRAELERLQAENTSEWDKREILEREKQGLEKENRRLKAQVKDMKEFLDREYILAATSQNPDLKTSQSQLLEKNKDLTELQRAYCKLNKQYQDKMAELIHANNRVDHYETEVKKLRFRVEDLKRGLNHAEDELDDSLNQIHKLQQSLDDQIKMNHNLQIQLNHLQSR